MEIRLFENTENTLKEAGIVLPESISLEGRGIYNAVLEAMGINDVRTIVKFERFVREILVKVYGMGPVYDRYTVNNHSTTFDTGELIYYFGNKHITCKWTKAHQRCSGYCNPELVAEALYFYDEDQTTELKIMFDLNHRSEYIFISEVDFNIRRSEFFTVRDEGWFNRFNKAE